MNTSMGPSLVEPNARYFIGSTLKQCRTLKNNYFNAAINIIIFVILISIISMFLFYKYKSKYTNFEKENKKKELHNYILTKLQQIEHNKKNNIITDLPEWTYLDTMNISGIY